MKSEEKSILVGLIASAHGIKGEAKIRSYTNPAGNICNLSLFTIDGMQIKLKSIKYNQTKNELICKLNSIDNRTDIEMLCGKRLFCLRSDLPELIDDDEFYIEDLKNLPVMDQQNQLIGSIKDVCNFGAGDLIEVGLINHNDEKTTIKSEFFPFTKEFFPIITREYVVLAYIAEP